MGEPYTAAAKKEAIERELKYRRRVYPRWVADGRMTQELAGYQIAIFEAILDEYAKAESAERLI